MTKRNIDFGVGVQARREIKALNKELQDAQKNVALVVGAFKDLSKLTQSMKANAIFGNQFGFNNVLRGTATRQQNSANALGFLGTNQGQQINTLKEQLRIGRQIEQSKKEQLANERAMSLQLFSKQKVYRDIYDRQRLITMIADAERRAILESSAGRSRQAAEARKLTTELQKQLSLVKQQEKSADTGRARKMDMLFGDSGASLFKVQAGLAFNYALMNQVRQTIINGAQFTVELDDSLRNLQAIVRVTDNGMQDLKQSLIDISEETKFTAVEVTNAAVTLGQAGLSVKEIEDATRAISLLATATGTDLAKAVDIATSVLGVFNMESQQMMIVANTITEAINSSKLNIDKLTLGLQYAGNTAAQSGVRFEELTAALGAMANSGIRSGSTLGTGMRQILISLQKPSGEFLKTLERLGLTIYDVDLRSKGLYGVLKTLKDAGFTAADAIKSFEVRSAAAYNAVQNNLDVMLELEESFLNSDAAIQANSTQMRSFTNQFKRFGSVIGSVISAGGEPLLYIFRDLLKVTSDFLSWLRDFDMVLKAVTVSVTSFVTAWGLLRVVALIQSLTGLGTALGSLNVWTLLTTASVKALGTALWGLMRNPIFLGTVGIASLAFMSFRKEMSLLSDATDKANAALEKSTGVVDQYSRKMEQVQGKIDELRDRSEILTQQQNLLQLETQKVSSEFGDMGLTANLAGSTVGNLISALQSLKAQLAQDYTLAINVKIGNLESVIALNNQAMNDAALNLNAFLGSALSSPGGSGTTTVTALGEVPDGSSRPTTELDRVQASYPALRGVLLDASKIARDVRRGNPPEFSVVQSTMNELNKIYTEAINNNDRAAQAEIQAIMQGPFAEIYNRARENDIFNRDLSNSRIEGNTVRVMQGPSYQRYENEIADVRTGVVTELDAILDNNRGGSLVNVGRDVRAYEKQVSGKLDQVERMIEAEFQAGTLDKGSYDAATSLLVEARGIISERIAGALEGPKGIEKTQADLALQRVEQAGQNFSSRLSSAKTTSEVDDFLAEELKRIDDETAAREIVDELSATDPFDSQSKRLIRDEGRTLAIEKARNDAQKAKERIGKKEGGGSSDDPFDLFMDNLDAGLSAGITGKDDSRIDFVMGTAREELEKLTSQINDFAGKQNLTVAQQKQLVELTEQHGELKDWILEAETQITDQLREQGIFQIDLPKTIEDWKKANLDFGATIESGLGSALSALKTGFSDLFTDLANGTKSAADAFRDFAGSVIKSIQNVIAEMLAMYLMQQVIGMIFPSGGSGFGAFARDYFGVSAATGGEVRMAAGGESRLGFVEGMENRDSKKYLLMPGEYVLRRSAVQAVGVDYLDQLNAMGNRRMATGGHIGAAKPSGKGQAQNLWLVDERSKAPVPGPNDIIAIVSDDMARNGPTRRLVKAIQNGTL